MLMLMAECAAKRTDCRRAQKGVGAVIASGGRSVSSGYAGPVSGAPSCSDAGCNLAEPCTRTVHAELNAILFAARAGVATLGCTMYSTTSPCIRCAEAIIQAGISRLVYREAYRDVGGLDLLRTHGVTVDHLDIYNG